MLSGKEARKSRPIHRRIGPGIFVTAAFIGPGTVLSASQAGADFGFTLLWAVVFSVVTAMILQEMAARLGIVSGGGLAESIRATMSSPALRWTMFALVLSAILLGNSAYQTGNILGAAAGLNLATGISDRVWCILIAAVALSLIGIGRFEVLQWLLMTLVGLMGAIFALSAIICGPDLIAVLAGLRPSLPDSGGLIVIGLIGTTVVPYNLFLHSSSAAERYGEYRDKRMAIRDSLFDLVLSIMVGGIISASLLITAAVTFPEGGLDSIADIAQQLRPTLGAWAETWFAMGLFAAGLTSSITAPLSGRVRGGRLLWVASQLVQSFGSSHGRIGCSDGFGRSTCRRRKSQGNHHSCSSGQRPATAGVGRLPVVYVESGKRDGRAAERSGRQPAGNDRPGGHHADCWPAIGFRMESD